MKLKHNPNIAHGRQEKDNLKKQTFTDSFGGSYTITRNKTRKEKKRDASYKK